MVSSASLEKRTRWWVLLAPDQDILARAVARDVAADDWFEVVFKDLVVRLAPSR
jgi:hypothetical protein